VLLFELMIYFDETRKLGVEIKKCFFVFKFFIEVENFERPSCLGVF